MTVRQKISAIVGLDSMFLIGSSGEMSDRPASWRMPILKQMEKLAATVGRQPSRAPDSGPGDAMPPEYWESLLSDPYADKTSTRSRSGVRTQRLVDIQQNLLRVDCRRCGRTVEIQKADAVRLAGAEAVWKDVGQRLLDDTCSERTGSHENDGCWPSFG